MSSPPKTTIELLRRSRGGDRQARQELFSLLGDENGFGAAILAMARRLLPKGHRARRFVETRDIVQSALRTGLRHFSDFRGESDGELYSWFRRILRTKVNRATRRKEPDIPDDQRKRREIRASVSIVVDKEFVHILHRAVKKLPLDQRLVVELRLRGVNSSEIGKMLGLKPATVRKRESRAMERLKVLVA